MRRRKSKRMKNRTLAIYQKNQSIVKGRLFEIVLKQLLLKAGFSTDIESDQVTKNKRRLHGRGATYDPDFFGRFRLGIPFINPLMIVAEAKYFNSKVHLKHVREFLGAYVDFSQYVRINTKASGERRYSVLHSTRYTYCPVFFSIKGYDRSAQGFMFAHGINYISYENSKIIERIYALIERLLKCINFSKFTTNDFKHFRELESISAIRDDLKKKTFNTAFSKFKDYLVGINSLIGVVDMKYPVNILYKRQIKASKIKKIRITVSPNGMFFLENTSKRKYGEFSMSKTLVQGCVAHAKRNGTLDRIFKQIDIIFPQQDYLEIKQLLVDEDSRLKLIGEFEKTPKAIEGK